MSVKSSEANVLTSVSDPLVISSLALCSANERLPLALAEEVVAIHTFTSGRGLSLHVLYLIVINIQFIQ